MQRWCKEIKTFTLGTLHFSGWVRVLGIPFLLWNIECFESVPSSVEGWRRFISTLGLPEVMGIPLKVRLRDLRSIPHCLRIAVNKEEYFVYVRKTLLMAGSNFEGS